MKRRYFSGIWWILCFLAQITGILLFFHPWRHLILILSPAILALGCIVLTVAWLPESTPGRIRLTKIIYGFCLALLSGFTVIQAMLADGKLHEHWLKLAQNGTVLDGFSFLWALTLGLIPAWAFLFEDRTRLWWQRLPWLLFAFLLPWAALIQNSWLVAIVGCFLFLELTLARKLRSNSLGYLRSGAGTLVLMLAFLGIGLAMAAFYPDTRVRSPVFLGELRSLGAGLALEPGIQGSGSGTGSASAIRAFNAPPERSTELLFRVQAGPGTTLYLATEHAIELGPEGWIALKPEQLVEQPPPSPGLLRRTMTLSYLGNLATVIPLGLKDRLVMLRANLSEPPRFFGPGAEAGEGLVNHLPTPLLKDMAVEVFAPEPIAPGPWTGAGWFTEVPPQIARNVLPRIKPYLSIQNPHERLMALAAYFKGAEYDIEAQFHGRFEEQLEDFLITRRGYCTQYASSFAIMARLAGIPARYVQGYVLRMPRDRPLGYIARNAAHAWVEVWLEGEGWLIMDTTPGGRVFATVPQYNSPGGVDAGLVDIADSSIGELGGGLGYWFWILAITVLALVGIRGGWILHIRLRPPILYQYLPTKTDRPLWRLLRRLYRQTSSHGIADPSRGGFVPWESALVGVFPRYPLVWKRLRIGIEASIFAGSGLGALPRGLMLAVLRMLKKRPRKGFQGVMGRGN